MEILLCCAAGAVLGFGAVKARMFESGDGLGLFYLSIFLVLVAAICGVLSALLPAASTLWTGRIALVCVAFVASAVVTKLLRTTD
jgi:hypothetical protein